MASEPEHDLSAELSVSVHVLPLLMHRVSSCLFFPITAPLSLPYPACCSDYAGCSGPGSSTERKWCCHDFMQVRSTVDMLVEEIDPGCVDVSLPLAICFRSL